LNILSTANNEASNAATQMTPGERELRKEFSVPNAKGKRLITIRKKTKGIRKVAIFLKDRARSQVLVLFMNNDPNEFLLNQPLYFYGS